MTDEDYIDIAIEISKTACFPYGAIVVKDKKIIGRSDDITLINKSMILNMQHKIMTVVFLMSPTAKKP